MMYWVISSQPIQSSLSLRVTSHLWNALPLLMTSRAKEVLSNQDGTLLTPHTWIKAVALRTTHNSSSKTNTSPMSFQPLLTGSKAQLVIRTHSCTKPLLNTLRMKKRLNHMPWDYLSTTWEIFTNHSMLQAELTNNTPRVTEVEIHSQYQPSSPPKTCTQCGIQSSMTSQTHPIW